MKSYSIQDGIEPILEPLYPKNAVSYWSIFLLLEIGAMLLVTLLVLAACWPLLTDILLGYLIAAWWLTPICLIFAGTQDRYLYKKTGSVKFDGETITVYANPDGTHRLYSAILTGCRWFYGSQSWATVPYSDQLVGYLGFGKTLLLEFPKECRTSERRIGGEQNNLRYAEGPVIISIGHTAETRLQWEQLFYRAGVERNEERDLLPAPFSQSFLCLLALLTLPLLFFSVIYGARLLNQTLIQWNIPADIAMGITFPIFVPGIIYIPFAICVWVFTSRKQSDVKQIKWENGNIISRSLGLWIVPAFLIGCSWVMIGQNGWTKHSAIAATIMNIFFAVFATCCVRQLLLPEKKELNSHSNGKFENE